MRNRAQIFQRMSLFLKRIIGTGGAFDKELLNRLHHVVNSDFAHVTYTEAIELLKKHQEQFTYPVEWGWLNRFLM